MKTVSLEQVGRSELALPPRVQETLGQLVGSAKEGLLALSVGVGLGVLAELLEEEVVEVGGPKGSYDPARTALRHGHEAGEVTLGSQRVAVERPRVRSADGRSGGAAAYLGVLRRPRSAHAPLRVRRRERVALHADLSILTLLGVALARARAVPLAA